jgi:hypothetical protein
MSKKVEIIFLNNAKVEIKREGHCIKIVSEMENFPVFLSVKDENGTEVKKRGLSIWEKKNKININLS